MDFTKKILIIQFLLLPIINFAQNKSELDCENGFEKIETELKSRKTVSYKIIYSQKLYTEDSFEFSEGIIILPDLNDQIQPNEIIETIARIGVKNKLSKVLAFKNCDAIGLYFQQSKLTPEQEDFLKNNLIAKVDIDINKSLSKKDRKKNKRKRDLIESVSTESCGKLAELNTNELSMEKINQIVSSTSVQYVEKIEKVYEMSFEESTIKFLEDLTNHLIVDCELMKEFAKEYKEKPE